MPGGDTMGGHPNTTHRNGHRRRELTRRIKATATHCSLCDQPLNPDAEWPADDYTVIDEDIPRVKGGSPLDPANTSAMHNACNRFKSTMTLAEAREALALGADVTKPMSKAARKQLLATNVGDWQPASAVW